MQVVNTYQTGFPRLVPRNQHPHIPSSIFISPIFNMLIPIPVWKREATPPPPSPPPPLAIEDVQPAKPGWRTIHKRPERKPKPKALPAPAPASAPAPAPPPPRDLPAWAQWRRKFPDPLFLILISPLTSRDAFFFSYDV